MITPNDNSGEITTKILAFATLYNGGICFTFHREEVFYPLVLQSDEEAVANAKCNPGTLRVVNEFTGKVVFEANTAVPDAKHSG